MKKCKHCKAANADTVRFCAQCGKAMPSKGAIVARNIGIGLLAFLVLGFVSGTLTLEYPDETTDTTAEETTLMPAYDVVTPVSYVELYDNIDRYKGLAVIISGPVDSVHEGWITFRAKLPGSFSQICAYVHESQPIDCTAGDYITVTGIPDYKTFGILAIKDCIITDRGEASRNDFEMQYAYYTDRLSRDAAESEEQRLADIESSKQNDYATISVADMYSELDTNAMRAEQTYTNALIKITGYISVIDSDGEYISVTATASSWDLKSVHCSLYNDEQRQAILAKNKGDKVTVWGKVSQVGEVMGYTLRVDYIE